MKEIIEALKIRLTSPLFGYFTLFLVTINWKALFFLVIQEKDVLGRIAYFQENTTTGSLIIWPVICALTFSLLYPWLSYLISWVNKKPMEMKNILSINAEHNLLMKRKELENLRSELLASAEFEIIGRAKRDQEVESIENTNIKDQIKSEIETLRKESATVGIPGIKNKDSGGAKELMDIADIFRKKSAQANNVSDREGFLNKARELEDRAHKMLMN